MELYLVRHGQSLAQTGQDTGPDPHLSETGLRQAQALARALENVRFDRIFSSHQTRAFQTAAAVGLRQGGVVPVEVVPELAECGVRPEWKADAAFHRSYYPKVSYHRDCLGKIYENDLLRARAALEETVFPLAYESGFTSEHGSEEGIVRSNDINVLIAAHGMFDAYLLGLLVNFPFDVNMVVEQRNTCVNHLSLYTVGGVRRVKFIAFNDAHHLDGLDEPGARQDGLREIKK